MFQLNLERMCADPHLPDLNGGMYDWNKDEMENSRSPFNTTVTYSCANGGRFANTEEGNKTKKYTCQWDQTWTSSDPGVSLKLTNDFKGRLKFINRLIISSNLPPKLS